MVKEVPLSYSWEFNFIFEREPTSNELAEITGLLPEIDRNESVSKKKDQKRNILFC